MATEVVQYESKDKIALITLNRPNALNAMDDEMIEALRAAWIRFNESDDQCAVVRGAGERAFSSGADMKNPPKEMWRGMPGIGVDVQKPIIAAIDGHCIGGGFVLVTMCDIAVATDRALFSYPEAQIGFTGGLIMAVTPRIPYKVAMEFMLCGERFTAQRACETGMINKVVKPGEELEAAMRYARILANSAPMVVQALKGFALEMTPKSGPELAARARNPLVEIERSEDRLEGQASFREKRKPVFKGR